LLFLPKNITLPNKGETTWVLLKTLLILLTTHSSVKRPKFAAEILKIQTLILTVQKDDAALVSKNLDLERRYYT